MRKHLIAGAILTAAMLVGVGAVQAKKPSGGSSGGSSGSHGSHGSHGSQGSGSGQMGQSNKSGPGSSSKGMGSGSSKNYLSSHGQKFSHGYFYKGKDHFHWSYQCFWDRFGCYCYWCPYSDCWYYYCQPRECYLPVSCLEFAPPTTNVNVNVANSAISEGNVIGSGVPADLPPLKMPVAPDGAGPVQNFNKNSIR